VPSSIFEPLIGAPNVEDAVLNTLRTWLPTYLWEIERQNDLRKGSLPHPPTPESFDGGHDFLTWIEDQCPKVIAVVNPVGEPERSGSIGYSQAFAVQVGAVLFDDNEADARRLAGHYGTAIQGTILQQGDLGGFAERTIMVQSPEVSFQDQDMRRLHQVVAVFHVFVTGIVSDSAGPDVPTPTDSPQYGGSPDVPFTDWPTVQTTDATVTAQPITEQ